LPAHRGRRKKGLAIYRLMRRNEMRNGRALRKEKKASNLASSSRTQGDEVDLHFCQNTEGGESGKPLRILGWFSKGKRKENVSINTKNL